MGKRKYTDQQVIDAVKESYSIAEVCRKVGLSEKGSNSTTIKKIISNLNLDISHFTGQSWSKGKNSRQDSRIRKKDLSEILVENSGWSSHALKLKLFKEGVKEYKCEKCGNTEWNGQPIPLELHHLNGNHKDNRLENLQILCPNCHAQTNNYSGGKISNLDSNREPKHKCFKCGKPLSSKRKTGLCNNCYNKNRVKVKIINSIDKVCINCGKPISKNNKSGYCSKCFNSCVLSKSIPEVNDLIERKKELKSYRKLAQHYSVSDKTIKSWFIYYNLV